MGGRKAGKAIGWRTGIASGGNLLRQDKTIRTAQFTVIATGRID